MRSDGRQATRGLRVVRSWESIDPPGKSRLDVPVPVPVPMPDLVSRAPALPTT
jgi:hypothetical protein